MISLARKALPNSFFSQPCQAEAEGRCICSSSGLCLVPAALLVCPSLVTGWEQWVRNRAVLPFLHRLHIDTWYIFIYTIYTIYIYNIFNIYMVYIKAAAEQRSSWCSASLRATCRRDFCIADSCMKGVIPLYKRSHIPNLVYSQFQQIRLSVRREQK